MSSTGIFSKLSRGRRRNRLLDSRGPSSMRRARPSSRAARTSAEGVVGVVELHADAGGLHLRIERFGFSSTRRSCAARRTTTTCTGAIAAQDEAVVVAVGP